MAQYKVVARQGKITLHTSVGSLTLIDGQTITNETLVEQFPEHFVKVEETAPVKKEVKSASELAATETVEPVEVTDDTEEAEETPATTTTRKTRSRSTK